MRWMKGMVLAIGIFAVAAAGCGGGDSGGGTTTPGATSSKTLLALSNATGLMYGTALMIPGALGGGGVASVKQYTTSQISCSGALDDFSCVIWDSQGSATSADHKCIVTGSATLNALYTFNLSYDCYDFMPDESVIVSGNWTADITINLGAMSSASASMSVDTGFEKAEVSGECNVQDVTNACDQTFSCDGGSCTVECGGAALCTEPQALAVIVWTVGSRGVTVTDPCGTFNLAVGSTSNTTMCMPSSTSFTMTFVINATINGEAVNDTINVNCQDVSI